MKLSNYNIYERENGICYIANTITGAIIGLSERELDSLLDGNFQDFSEDEIDSFKNMGILLPAKIDEIALMRQAYNTCKYSFEKSTITIMPTLECNFNCPYCYENRVQGHMPVSIQNETVNFIKSLIQKNNTKTIDICWYGGEPTLYKSVIQKVSNDLIDFCKSKGVMYNASMITNGYLIDSETLNLFHECRIRTAQITLDGSKAVHDKRRTLSNGKGTFDVIYKNIYNLANAGIQVGIRVNIDKSNIKEYKKVVKLFNDSPEIFVYPAAVTIESTQDNTQQNKCFTQKSYEELYKLIYSKDDTFFKDDHLPGVCNCCAEHINSYVISPEGKLFKCLNDVCDAEMAMGDVKQFRPNEKTAKYMGRDPFSEPECHECSYLPLCYGGCVDAYTKYGTHACRAVKFLYKRQCYEKIKHSENY